MPTRSRLIQSSRVAKRRRKARLRQILFLLCMAVPAFAIIVGLTHLNVVHITSVTVSGNVTTNSSDITAIANEDISGNYFAFFSRSNAFLYPKQKISTDILNTFKTLSTVSVGEVNLHTIQISVTERQPFAMWCGATPPAGTSDASSSSLTTTSSCYFFDQTGFLYSAAPDLVVTPFLKYYGPLSSDANANPIGQTYLSSTTLAGISNFIEVLADGSTTAVSFSMPTATEYEIDTASSTKIYLDPQHSFTDDLSNLSTVLNNPTLQISSVDILQYLDLRLDDKVFYKLK